MDATGRIRNGAIRLPAWAKGLSVPDKHQLRIALDTIENPLKALLGGPSVEEAKEIVTMLKNRSGGRRSSVNARMAARMIVAGAMKRWLEDVSVDMGLDGDINDDVIAEGQRRLAEAGTAQSAPQPASDIPTGGLKPAAQLLKKLPTIDGVKPHGMVTDDGHLMISAEEGDGLIDFYGEFRGGYPYIHPKLEKWATEHGGFFEWDNPGSVTLYER